MIIFREFSTISSNYSNIKTDLRGKNYVSNIKTCIYKNLKQILSEESFSLISAAAAKPISYRVLPWPTLFYILHGIFQRF